MTLRQSPGLQLNRLYRSFLQIIHHHCLVIKIKIKNQDESKLRVFFSQSRLERLTNNDSGT